MSSVSGILVKENELGVLSIDKSDVVIRKSAEVVPTIRVPEVVVE